MILKVSEVKKLVKEADKRSSKEFITAFDEYCQKQLAKLIADHNAGKKTLIPEQIIHVLGG